MFPLNSYPNTILKYKRVECGTFGESENQGSQSRLNISTGNPCIKRFSVFRPDPFIGSI